MYKKLNKSNLVILCNFIYTICSVSWMIIIQGTEQIVLL